MRELQKGQVVACWDRDDCDKAIRIYIGKEGMVHRCRLPGIEYGDPDFELWEFCVPLEELAPEAFLVRERRAGEQVAEAVAKESEPLQRLRRQIRWLCKQLDRLSQDSGNCLLPAGAGTPSDDSCRVGGCGACWRLAARKAVEEDADGVE